MVLFRLLAVLFVIGIAVCVGAYLFTGQKKYLHWAFKATRVALVLAIAFFTVLVLERLG